MPGKGFDFSSFDKCIKKLPFLSTDLKPALAKVSLKLLFNFSLLKFTFLKLGKNLLVVLLLAWLTIMTFKRYFSSEFAFF
jgi:hypothetical protein